ncbi:DMT family transporter [Aeromicrobium sp.]|uniref:DMT family transporter n=1 Tax=Aeromicrobium sp. TaxID=1871063 RepID=UPI003C3BDF66
MSITHARPRPVLMLVGAAACWGIGTVISKHALDGIEPITLLTAQLLTSTAFLFGVILIQRVRIVWTPDMRRLAALGVLNPGIAYALGLLGLTYITASMSVLIWATEPVLILVLAVVLLHERISVGLGVALGVAVLGVLLVVYQGGASGTVLGVLLTVAAVGACALYTVIARHLLVDDTSIAVAAVQQAAALAFAAVLLAAVELFTDGGTLAESVPAITWLWAALSGLLYYGFAFWLYLSGLTDVSAPFAGSFITLVPVFGVTAALFIGEHLTARQWWGAAIVLGALAYVASRQDRQAT